MTRGYTNKTTSIITQTEWKQASIIIFKLTDSAAYLLRFALPLLQSVHLSLALQISSDKNNKKQLYIKLWYISITISTFFNLYTYIKVTIHSDFGVTISLFQVLSRIQRSYKYVPLFWKTKFQFSVFNKLQTLYIAKFLMQK